MHHSDVNLIKTHLIGFNLNEIIKDNENINNQES